MIRSECDHYVQFVFANVFCSASAFEFQTDFVIFSERAATVEFVSFWIDMFMLSPFFHHCFFFEELFIIVLTRADVLMFRARMARDLNGFWMLAHSFGIMLVFSGARVLASR